MIKEINVVDLEKKITHNENFVLLDVRTPDEYTLTHIKKSVHIPLDTLDKECNKLEKNKEIVVYCHHGVRSLKATKILLDHGFLNVRSLSGGIHAWSTQVDPSLPIYS